MSDRVGFKLGTFSDAAAPFPGLVIEDRVIALHALGPSLAACATMWDVLENWERAFEALCRAANTVHPHQGRSLSELRVHAPVPKPGTIYCSGANYKKHVVDLIVAHQDQAETQGMTLEQRRAWGMKLMDERAANGTPFIFIKPRSAVTGPYDRIVVPLGTHRDCISR